ncbi:phenylacetate--CoA ligase PaaK [Scopulibacillus cellulosilyticus]|uniref:Phenylacetate-coenzyme A ligase n=1 Tax=Scopulibacillus cellulosilyticus TaxID=2665665 RepID=A0ABW2PT66_9BACL
MAQEKMKALQLRRLKETIRTVFEKVPFYRESFKKHHVIPDDIQSLEDISRLPFTVKKDLRDHYPFGLFAVQQKDIIRIHASSGTSGKPTVAGYTRRDIDNWAEAAARAIAAAGGKPGEVLHNAYGYGLFTGGLGLHYGSEKLGMATVPVSGGNTERQIMLIEDFKPTIITGTPSYILNIIDKMEIMGKNPKETSLKYGIFGAEPWSEEMRKELEARLDIKAVDIYGLSEVMGPGVAVECHEIQDGLHIMDDLFYVEVIDPETLEPVPDGQIGELVFTSLTKEAMPVIRYRTGDIASITRETCGCGRTTTKMSRIKGRIDDMLIIRGVNVFPSEIENVLLQVEELQPHYQLALSKKGRLDEVALNVEIHPSIYGEIEQNLNHDSILQLKGRISHLLKSKCLVSINVNVLEPGSIPRSEGKAVRVVDLRKKELSDGPVVQ